MTTGETGNRALEAAMDWLLEIQAAPEDEALRARFEAWLASDPNHPRAWDRARKAWNIMDDVTPAFSDQWTAGAERRKQRRHSRPWTLQGRPVRRLGAGLAAAALAACLMLVFAPTVALHLRADHVTATAELQTVTLADGSQVALGPRSAISTDFADGHRRVTLLAGEAWFDVKSDPTRPFVVQAGGVDTTVLGTAFDVRLDPKATSVAVERGLVRVRADLSGHVDVRLEPGQSIMVDHETGAGTLAEVPTDAVASWRGGKLYANNATVAEVIEQLRRYDSGWIVITDEELARRRVTGLYDANNPDAAMQALLHAGGGRARKITPLLTLLSAD